MNKEYIEYLRKNDPIHYSEMMGDPVTGIRTNSSSNVEVFLIVIFLIGIGVVIGVSI
ncbi:hypothetical protein PL373_02610 [Tenacibaculum maritimum]|nr:hypothetical protein [Tenacibaculum maritimum]MDB0600064.1 hypothetical protein [Tenacibaculum maritimum]MDB0611181.1 hypothetical protein [Tenacibaculum maritimum]